MYKVAIITEEQAFELKQVQIQDKCFFNPIQDKNNNWVVSEQEINQSDLIWLKELDLIDYEKKQETEF